MSVKNCKRCGAIFNDEVSQICSECKKVDDLDFQKVKDYLEENPRASLMEVSKVLKLSPDKVKRFLRDGRLETVGDGASVLECEKCGGPISSGRYCDECQFKLLKGIKDASGSLNREPNKSSPSGGFLFKARDKK